MPLKPSRKPRPVLLGVAIVCCHVTPLRADEALPALRINGLPLEVTRLAGPDVRSRVAALEALWRSRGDAVLPWQEQGGWRVLAHRVGTWNEVLQVRGRDAASEAFLSRLDVQHSPRAVPVLPLPAACRARSTVESGGRSDRAVQVTGQCALDALVAWGAWAKELGASGWKGGAGAGGSVFRFRRGDEEFVVVLAIDRNGGTDGTTRFTALQRHVVTEESP